MVTSIGALGASVVDLGDNVGFAGACNADARMATGDFLLFVNPDVECDLDTIEALLPTAESGALVGPLVRTTAGKVERSVKSKSYLSTAVLISRELIVGRWVRLGSLQPTSQRSLLDALSGACLVMRKDVFARLRGFNERYFLHGEDIDLSFRARGMGMSCVYDPDATVTHASGIGAGGVIPDETTLATKGHEARRAEAHLLEDHRSVSARTRYLRLLRTVLAVRICVATLCALKAKSVRVRAAMTWLTNGAP